MKKVNIGLPVTVYSLQETSSPLLKRGRVRVFYKGKNRNGVIINDEVANQLVDSLFYIPVKGNYYADKKDFGGHDGYEGEVRYGFVPAPDDRNFAWEKHLDADGEIREYACTDVIIWNIDDEAERIIGKPQSMELDSRTLEGDWVDTAEGKYFEFTRASFLGLQILGNDTEPCFEGASFFESSLTNEERDKAIAYYTIFSQLDATNQLGGIMDKVMQEMLEAIQAQNKEQDDEKVTNFTNVPDPEHTDTEEQVKHGQDGEEASEPYAEVEEEFNPDQSEEEVEEAVEEEQNDEEPVNALPEDSVNKFDDAETDEPSKEETNEDNFSQKIVELEQELSTYKRSIADIQAEVKTLREYKAKVEKEQKQELVSEYQTNYNLSDEMIKPVVDNLDNFETIEDVKRELAVITLENKSSFSQESNAYIPNNSTPDGKSDIANILDQYK